MLPTTNLPVFLSLLCACALQLELLSDLVLIDELLSAPGGSEEGGCGEGAGNRVVLACKNRPVFVSDAMPCDVNWHIMWLSELRDPPHAEYGSSAAHTSTATAAAVTASAAAQFSSTRAAHATSTTSCPQTRAAHALAARLRDHLASGRLTLIPSYFWSLPFPLWEAPEDVYDCWAGASLVIFKGDANYRRLLVS